MLKKLLLTTLLTAICAAELVSIANYTGKHDSSCLRKSVTGAMVKGKLYTFGGCYKVAYVVDPNSIQDNFRFDYNDHLKTTDEVQVYDVVTDTWSLESNTPIPIKLTGTQVVDNAIYLFDILPEKRQTSSKMYKYDTESKVWTTLPDIPFLWAPTSLSLGHRLLSCYDGRGKIYFTGAYDGFDRNIIHSFDTTKDEWTKSPIFMDKRLIIKQMICNQDHIKFIAYKEDAYHDTNTIYVDEVDNYELFSTSYLDGSTVSDNYSFAGDYRVGAIGRLGNWVFLSNAGESETTFYRLNIMTHENVTMATLPYDLIAPLIAPVNEKEILLLGGAEPFPYGRTHRNDIQKYNHKLIYSPYKHDEL
ncbi:hypothetical protein MAM1_0027d02205 [Mucor ambiguus]|uniref:Kelch repeat protein n=1 Tax=Mucor ambiguus TaxID=91626 RepID=A0A0C9MLR3_9FUNG|nr:hypothetical protein MAM1_0027d02205 [Mucor ambiguus]